MASVERRSGTDGDLMTVEASPRSGGAQFGDQSLHLKRGEKPLEDFT